ncbi:glycerol dehydrogenase [Pararhizobium capsulatum DSM 1112]|uniref:Glycerol dehydrogenase n=1 Tax=Pararhizobium capsulatum DSM 1112 TaxID=1121113 RepID=A0ABU0BYC6_9HYPH|nr:glycerol dehydrogenase [Pararhizobium capsulatum]MDQ0323268.1 glycerol dehydrogenase [Pararhizobium capsulatum DSM 1112]
MTSIRKIFGAPHRYIQGPDALDELGQVAAAFGPSPAVIADAFILEKMGPRIEAILRDAGLTPIICAFDGEITYAAIDAVIATLGGIVPSVAIGIGGGKSLDASKGLALKLGIDVITVPTIASNDSPTSASIAMYDDHHVMISVDRLKRSPQAVIVDTKLIAAAPALFLRAGIGDAISKKFEADGCLAGNGITPFGTRPLLTAIVIADACYRVLREHSEAALQSVELGEVSDALEATIEAVILMSGLGFENGGLSLSHSLTRGLVKARGAKNAIHGQHVAWGVLVQLAAEGRSDAELADIIAFHRSIELATTLQQLGMEDATGAEIAEIADWTMTAPHLNNLPFSITAVDVAAAIRRVERLAA